MLAEEDGYVEIRPEEGFGGLQPAFSPTTELKTTNHIDISPVGVDPGCGAGAAAGDRCAPADVGRSDEESWHVLQGPEGNEFCLLHRRLNGTGAPPRWSPSTEGGR